MKNVTKAIAIATVVASAAVTANWGGNNMSPFSGGNNWGPMSGGNNMGPLSGG